MSIIEYIQWINYQDSLVIVSNLIKDGFPKNLPFHDLI